MKTQIKHDVSEKAKPDPSPNKHAFPQDVMSNSFKHSWASLTESCLFLFQSSY